MEKKKAFRNVSAILLAMILIVLAGYFSTSAAKSEGAMDSTLANKIDIFENKTAEDGSVILGDSILSEVQKNKTLEGWKAMNDPDNVINVQAKKTYTIKFRNEAGEEVNEQDGPVIYRQLPGKEMEDTEQRYDNLSFSDIDDISEEYVVSLRIYSNNKEQQLLVIKVRVNPPEQPPTPAPTDTPTPTPEPTATPSPTPIPKPVFLPGSGFVDGTEFYLSANRQTNIKVFCSTDNCRVALYCGDAPVFAEPVKPAGEDGKYACTFDVTDYVRKNAKNDGDEMSFRADLIYPQDLAANMDGVPADQCEKITSEPFALKVVGIVRFDGTTDSITSDDSNIYITVNRNSGHITIPEIGIEAEIGADGKAQIELPEDKKAREDVTLTLQYKNDKEETGSFTIAYTFHQWEPIRIELPKGILHLYDVENKEGLTVEIAVTGEAGKKINAVLPHPEGTWNASTVDGKENHFFTTYERLKQANQIEFTYAEKADQDLKKTVIIKNEGEPDDGSLVVVWHTLSVSPVTNDMKEISVTGAVPGSKVQLMIDDAEKDSQDADKDGSLVFHTDKKMRPGTHIVVNSEDQFGGKTSAETTVTKEEKLTSLSKSKVTGIQDEAEIPQKDDVYYTNHDIRVQGSGHPEQVIAVELTGPDGKAVPIQPVEDTREISTDAEGKWAIDILAEKYADGDYRLSVWYPDYDESATAIAIRIDRECDILGLNSKGQIEVYENDTSFEIEAEAGETLSKATFTYYGAPIEGKISEDSSKVSFEFTDRHAFFHLADDQLEEIYVKVTDFTSNEAVYPIHVIPQSMTLTLNGEKIPESVYLKNDGGITFRAEGKTEAKAQIYMDNGENPVAELASGDEFVLNTENIGKVLNEMDEIVIRIVLPEQEDTLLKVVYDPECELEAKQTNGTDGNYIPMENKDDYIQIDKMTTEIIGSADPDAKVTLTIRHKDSNEEEPVIAPTNRDGREFRYSGLELLPGDTLALNATDAAGNKAAPITLRVKTSAIKSPAGIFLLVAGLILFVFSLMFFLNTQKKIKQVKEISAANAATIRHEEKH